MTKKKGVTMLKDLIFKLATPVSCMLATAFAPMGLAANQYYNNNSDCCDPCQQQQDCCQPDPCCQTGCGTNWGVFAGSAAVGAIAGVVAGVVAANANKSSHHHRGTGDVGPTGPTGPAGVDGAGFTIAVVPPGLPGEGTPVASLTFTFTTLDALALPTEAQVQTYVTTPEGRTIIGGTFPAVAINGTANVVISSGPFYSGQYDVGVILPTGLTSRAAVVSVEVTDINGNAISTLDDVGIVIGAASLTTETFFNAQYPFTETPAIPFNP